MEPPEVPALFGDSRPTTIGRCGRAAALCALRSCTPARPPICQLTVLPEYLSIGHGHRVSLPAASLLPAIQATSIDGRALILAANVYGVPSAVMAPNERNFQALHIPLLGVGCQCSTAIGPARHPLSCNAVPSSEPLAEQATLSAQNGLEGASDAVRFGLALKALPVAHAHKTAAPWACPYLKALVIWPYRYNTIRASKSHQR
ncbi:hypothetical protein SCAR479_06653 [Seiridium cardinale]|uniref:Uncharacterized protein n=1 Tax=Seiridium cardinale TaxID=138064 RepID=A0ABR2XS53_9PEZI